MTHNESRANESIFSSSNNSDRLDLLNARYATLLPLTIVLGLFGIVGIVGNVLVFVVYGCGKQFKDKKFRYYVLSLALIDLVTCMTLIPAEMLKHQQYFNFTGSVWCKIKCFFNVFAAAASSYCLVLVAIDRYMLTCRPVVFCKVRSISHGLAWRLCLSMLVLAVLTSLPSSILCGITSDVLRLSDDQTIFVNLCEIEPYCEYGISRYVYRISLGIVQVTISAVMIVLYARIGLEVWKAVRIRAAHDVDLTALNHHHHNHAQQPYHRAVVPAADIHHHQPPHQNIPSNVKLLFVVTVIYIVTYMFYLALSWVDQTRLSQAQFFAFSVFYRAYFIHSIINPLLYLKMDTLFRRRCKKIFSTAFPCTR
ncbi:olfactory receptor 8B3-like [Dreissena polymorpha]|uniref:G-protein coupled receptors family 1 profile domain-containing protein n=1 Tax=Dreissena polymorpha TaxID=45954 RepID=A0A9D4F0V1_DREPO|nr:olfactory receptor 8B3-like [Dreissena polymorpha]XP_052226061.1 olfactory receptor 8B3-like [Dreissena polymorpha]KAH3787427.1 hypothetical protein DPMN_165551 [Dreissena polymorpha]